MRSSLRTRGLVALAVLACCVAALLAPASLPTVHAAHRLPSNFYFGAATAAYQIEGAWDVNGKQPSEWDLFSHLPKKIAHGDNGDVADESYFRWAEDIELLKNMGVNSYRFSLSWGRIIDANGDVNPKGIAHYSAIIDALKAADIEPFVTLYHWDLPLQYGTMMGDDGRGWLNASYIVPLFTRYADAVFDAFGDRVRNFIIFNEPHSFCVQGFGYGPLAPGRCSDRSKCDAGDSSTEPYLCAHSVLLAYASATNLWRQTYEPRFGKAQIGCSLDASHAEPLTQSPADVAAAERAMIWMLAWWADPMFLPDHDYPQVMRENVGDRLPILTDADKAALATATPDFFGFNHYTSFYSYEQTNSTDPLTRDIQAGQTPYDLNGNPIGPKAASSWLFVAPWGFPRALEWIAKRYHNPTILVTENGVDAPDEVNTPLPKVLRDQFRVDYLHQYLGNMTEVAMGQIGVNVAGYFVWSLLDNFEWADGYRCRFGLHYVDYANGRRRFPKDSVAFYTRWIRDHKAIGDQLKERHLDLDTHERTDLA